MTERKYQFLHAYTHTHKDLQNSGLSVIYLVEYTLENTEQDERDFLKSNELDSMERAVNIAMELVEHGYHNVSIHQQISLNGQWLVENTIYQLSEHLHGDPIPSASHMDSLRAEVARLSETEPTDPIASPALPFDVI
jgi:hypothetical protein